MGQFIVGQIVSSNFPFSDLSTNKRRPALIVATVEFDDLILCQITSKPYSSSKAIKLVNTAFDKGGLPRESYIRPDKLFTADKSVVDKVHGYLKQEKIESIKHSLRDLFT